MSSDPTVGSAAGGPDDEDPDAAVSREAVAGQSVPDEAVGDEAADDEAVAGEPAADDESADDDRRPGPSLSTLARLARSRHVAWGVALVSLLVAIAAAAYAASVAREQAQDREAVARAELVAEQVTTFRGEEIDAWVEQTQALATGAYADRVEGMFDTEFREALEDNEVESTGEVTRSYLQQRDGDTATVFVLARQLSTNVLRDERVEDSLRMEIAMSLEGGEWYASDISVLGPAPAAPAAPGLEGAPEEDADESDESDGPDAESAEPGGPDADAEDGDEP